MPVLLHSVTEEGVTISKLSMEPLPFNERRDPAADSPYNAFDGDIKTSALYSNFTLEFSKPVTIDQIKIMNGNSASKADFKKSNRERDIEITLYTLAVKKDKKAPLNKTKKVNPQKKEETKIPVKDKEQKNKNIQDKSKPGKTDKEKAVPDKNDEKKIETEKNEEKKVNNKKEKTEEKSQEQKDEKKEKSPTPEKIVYDNENEILYETDQDNIKLFFTASETIIEPDKKVSDVSKSDDFNKTKKNKKTKADKTLAANKNIIEITDSKKEKENLSSGVTKKSDPITEEDKPEPVKSPIDETEIKKTLAGKDKPAAEKIDKPVKKVSKQPDTKLKKSKLSAVKEKKSPQKTASAKKEKKPVAKKPQSKDKPVLDRIASKKIQEKKADNKKSETIKPDRTKIQIVENKKKTDKAKIPAADKTFTDKKNIKTSTMKKPDDKKTADNKKEPVKTIPKTDEKKFAATKPDAPKADAAKPELKKTEDKKKIEAKKSDDKKTESGVTVKKMTGIVRIENDKDGRVMVYATLKDTMDFQNIGLKGKYTVTKIDFRTRDDGYYNGTEPDRSGITEISFLNNGKKISFPGIDALKKSYIERYSRNLTESISGQTFIMYDNNEIALRMKFRKDGKMEFFDRFKCSKKGDPDCTSLSMPDMWRVTDGKLYMRYHTLWRVWKYELDSQNDMLDDNAQTDPPRWIKLYYKSENGFTERYLDMFRSENGIWAE